MIHERENLCSGSRCCAIATNPDWRIHRISIEVIDLLRIQRRTRRREANLALGLLNHSSFGWL